MTIFLQRFALNVLHMRKLQSEYANQPRESLRREMVKAEKVVDEHLAAMGFLEGPDQEQQLTFDDQHRTDETQGPYKV